MPQIEIQKIMIMPIQPFLSDLKLFNVMPVIQHLEIFACFKIASSQRPFLPYSFCKNIFFYKFESISNPFQAHTYQIQLKSKISASSCPHFVQIFAQKLS